MMIVGLNTHAQIILIGLIGGSTLFTFFGGSSRRRVPYWNGQESTRWKRKASLQQEKTKLWKLGKKF